jgi:hypothetical protein
MSGALLAVALPVVSPNDLNLVLFFTSTDLVFLYAGSSVDSLAFMQNPEWVNNHLRSVVQKN